MEKVQSRAEIKTNGGGGGCLVTIYVEDQFYLVKTPPAFLIYQCLFMLFQLQLISRDSKIQIKPTSSSPDTLDAPASKGESCGRWPRPSYLELVLDAVSLYTLHFTHLSILRLGSPIHGIRLFPPSMLKARSSSLK